MIFTHYCWCGDTREFALTFSSVQTTVSSSSESVFSPGGCDVSSGGESKILVRDKRTGWDDQSRPKTTDQQAGSSLVSVTETWWTLPPASKERGGENQRPHTEEGGGGLWSDRRRTRGISYLRLCHLGQESADASADIHNRLCHRKTESDFYNSTHLVLSSTSTRNFLLVSFIQVIYSAGESPSQIFEG